jgi:DNA-binding transcriptional ArsR family regulator
MQTQIIGMKTWLTVNEQRELDGMEPIEGGDTLFEPNASDDAPGGDISNESTNMLSTQVAPGGKKFQTSSKSKSDAADLMQALFSSELSINELARMLDVSPTTVSKIRSKVDADNTPQLKEDEVVMKADAVQLDENLYEIEDVPVVLPQTKYYEHLGYEATRPREEIERIFNDPAYPKEFRIGVTPSDDHASRIPLEVLKENTVGMVQFKRLDEAGNIRGNIRYNLAEADRILGKDNWIRAFTSENKPLPTSVALYSKDRKDKTGVVERDLDIRSFVFTQKPRNPEAGQ